MSPDDKQCMLQEYILHTIYVLISSKRLLSLELAGIIFVEIISKVIKANQIILLFVSIKATK